MVKLLLKEGTEWGLANGRYLESALDTARRGNSVHIEDFIKVLFCLVH